MDDFSRKDNEKRVLKIDLLLTYCIAFKLSPEMLNVWKNTTG